MKWFLLALALCGCFPALKTPKSAKSYVIGERLAVRPGEVMVQRVQAKRTGEYQSNIETSQDELMYVGCEGSVVRLLYREFKDQTAREPFFVELTYDLNRGTIIVFRGYQIKIFNADNGQIQYLVMADDRDIALLNNSPVSIPPASQPTPSK